MYITIFLQAKLLSAINHHRMGLMSQDQFHLKELLAIILKESKTLVQKCKVPAESKLLYIILRIMGFQSKNFGRVFVKMSLTEHDSEKNVKNTLYLYLKTHLIPVVCCTNDFKRVSLLHFHCTGAGILDSEGRHRGTQQE